MRYFTMLKDDCTGEFFPALIEKDLSNIVPQVGVFFCVDDETIMDAVPTEKGEPIEKEE